MTTRISKTDLIEDFQKIGIRPGDVVLIRASLGAVGKISGGAEAFIDALSDVVGAEGTIVSLAFTDSVTSTAFSLAASTASAAWSGNSPVDSLAWSMPSAASLRAASSLCARASAACLAVSLGFSAIVA